MTEHHSTETVQEGPGAWVVVCSCGHRAEGEHPRSAEGRHQHHVGIEQARSALRGGR